VRCRRLAPRRFVLAEWNYCLENTLAETSIEFLFNIRRVTAAFVAALRERHPLSEARAVARDWMSLDKGQLTCNAVERQECFLDVNTWIALLELSGYEVLRPHQDLLLHAPGATLGEADLYVATSHYANAVPIALVQASSGQ
jgi:hypothetical protein